MCTAMISSLLCQKLSEQEKTNRRINGEIKTRKKEIRKIFNILLLGSGGCGKSTFLKQMKIIESEEGNVAEPFPLEERRTKWRMIVFSNIFSGIRVLLEQMQVLRIRFSNSENERKGREIMDIESFQAFLTADRTKIRPDFALKVETLWADPGIQSCFERRSEYQLEDSTQYFLDNLEHVLEENYIPSVEHVLHVRVKTEQIYHQDIPLKKGGTMRMIDVGGQRIYREKWIHYFSEVVTIIFITSLSEFNLKLEEDQNVSRTDESLGLFQKIAENKFFLNTCVILFLNKKDLLQQKLQRGVNFQDYFPEFDPDDFEDKPDYPKEAEYMMNLYTEKVEDLFHEDRPLYSHVTCATDTNNVKIIWNVVRNTILENAMKLITLN